MKTKVLKYELSVVTSSRVHSSRNEILLIYLRIVDLKKTSYDTIYSLKAPCDFGATAIYGH